MPTYEFRCPQGHEFEKLYRTISGAEAQSACPQCGALSERIMSATGFAFKGSGFYLTDYGKNAHRDKGTPAPANASGSGEGSKSDSGSGGGESGGGKADAAPAAPAAASGGEGGKSATAKPAAEPKPAPAPAKKSASE